MAELGYGISGDSPLGLFLSHCHKVNKKLTITRCTVSWDIYRKGNTVLQFIYATEF